MMNAGNCVAPELQSFSVIPVQTPSKQLHLQLWNNSLVA